MAGLTPPQLSPAALFADQARLDAIRLEVYNRMLATVHQKIKTTATLPGNPQMASFDVPEWQPGCPRFDVKDCILYIVWNLRHSGFKVIYISPNRLLISWQDQSMRYYKEESPIRQAMLAAAAGVPAPAAASRIVPVSEKKKAAAYRPPPSDGIASMLSGGGTSAKKTGSSTTITFI
jgi:hypothetical protein